MSSSVTVSRSELRRVDRSDSVEFTIGVIADVTTILLVVVAMYTRPACIFFVLSFVDLPLYPENECVCEHFMPL
jgi:hypothetical protein